MKKYLFGAVLLSGLVFLMAVPRQTDAVQIMLGYSMSFLGYIGLYSLDKTSWSFSRLFLLAIVARVLMIPFFPNLSDDIYRFYWDAIQVDNGISPYAYLPSEIVKKTGEGDIFQKLNSPNYFSIYPPLNQVLYYLAYKLGHGIVGFSVVLKIEYILLESLGLYYLSRLAKNFDNGKDRWFAYSLNPLIIIEGTGNLHIEVVMVSFLIIGLYYFLNNKKIWKGMLFYIAAVGVKIVPLLIGPFILFRSKYLDQKKIIGFGLLYMLIFFGPILLTLDLDTFSQSLDLYFRKFEFNASIYYLFRFLGFTFLGYNLIAYIGPILSLFVLGAILFFADKFKKGNLEQWFSAVLMGWSIYLFFATIIHPWYIIPLILFGTLTKWKFPLLWSYLIVLSYMSYGSEPFKENLWFVGTEYCVLFCYIYWESKIRLAPKNKVV